MEKYQKLSLFIILIPTPDFPHFYYMLGGNLGSLLYGDVSVDAFFDFIPLWFGPSVSSIKTSEEEFCLFYDFVAKWLYKGMTSLNPWFLPLNCQMIAYLSSPLLWELGTNFPQSQPLVKDCQFGVSPVNYSEGFPLLLWALLGCVILIVTLPGLFI